MSDYARIHEIDAPDLRQKYGKALRIFGQEEIDNALSTLDEEWGEVVEAELWRAGVPVGTKSDISGVVTTDGEGALLDADFYRRSFVSLLEIRGYVALRTACARILVTWIRDREGLEEEARIFKGVASRFAKLPPHGYVKREIEPLHEVALETWALEILEEIQEKLDGVGEFIRTQVGSRGAAERYPGKVAIAAVVGFLQQNGITLNSSIDLTTRILKWWGLIEGDPAKAYQRVKSALRSSGDIMESLRTKERPRTKE